MHVLGREAEGKRSERGGCGRARRAVGGAGERRERHVGVWRAKRAAEGGRRQASHSRRRRRFAS